MRKSVLIILILIIFSTVLIYELGIKSEKPFIKSETPTGHVVYEPEAIPVEDAAETAETTENTIEKQEGEYSIPVVDAVSSVKCIDNKIELLLTNPTDKALTLARDIRVHVNGMIVVDPECDRNTLMPDRSVYCSDISGHLAIKNGKENRVTIDMGSDRSDIVVDCNNQ
jgi:hypothetical protein